MIFQNYGNVMSSMSIANLVVMVGMTISAPLSISHSLEIRGGVILLTNTTGTINYGTSSTLIYNTGGTYLRGAEWSVQRPYMVQIDGGTTLMLYNGECQLQQSVVLFNAKTKYDSQLHSSISD
jgi:hypothetical protein